ncbi:MAG: YbjQ family protein [bacterium]|nr:YbjQ family protein [bacterium]MCP5068557.1 YbjQ family protein [bacterium]
MLLPFALLALGFAIGKVIESAHFRSLRRREIHWRRVQVSTLSLPPQDWRVVRAGLVDGSVVISIDHWKRMVAGLRALFGGRIRSYESLLERARREAVLRMKESAHARGFHGIVGARLETARLASTSRDGKGTAGIEILAFGTGIEAAR